MTICPDCERDLPGDGRCANCHWEVGTRRGIKDYLSTRDRHAPVCADYLRNYDHIADDDLRQTIQPHSRLDAEADRVCGYVGDLDGARVCEIGVGQGFLFRRLQASGAASVTGIDIAADYLERFDDNGTAQVLIANAENVPFRDEFDLIVATDILEHVLNPGDFLLSAHRALRNSGRLFVRVPCKENLLQYSRLAGCPYDLVHLRAFDRRSLARDLRFAGFRPQRTWYDGYTLDHARSWLRALQSKSGPAPSTREYWAASWVRRDSTTKESSVPVPPPEHPRRGVKARLRSRAQTLFMEIGEANNLLSRMMMQPVTISMMATRTD